MPTDSNHLQALFEKYMNNTCTKQEWEELLQLIREDRPEADLQQAFKAYWDQVQTQVGETDYWNERFGQMLQEAKEIGHPVVVMKQRRRWISWVAAAAILVLVIGGWWIFRETSNEKREKIEIAKTNDIPAPSNTRAVITLADGSKVYLDNVNKGTIAQQNDVNVVRNDQGGIEYDASGQRGLETITYNTLSNPRGSKVISLKLSDGTRVWLNSESSLKYPTAFNGNTREVEITGEAYFEVAHNASKPFHVKRGETDITVLGTHFNVNAYDDEDELRVTLLEGSVRVATNAASATVTIKPGEQAIVTHNAPISTRNIDVNAATAWVNGFFQFDNADMQTIMRQISRWYDMEVEYKENISKTFGGKIPRSMSAKNVFKVLEETGGVHFKIEGQKVTVMK